MYQIVFTTTIDTMLFSVGFYRNFEELWSSVRSWTLETGTPTDLTGSPEHRKNYLDEVQARSGTVTYPEELTCHLNVCYTVLYS